MKNTLLRLGAFLAAGCCLTVSAYAIDLDAYRKINRPGMAAAEVLLIAGEPDSRQRQGNCSTWFYRGTDTALENKLILVSLCDNKVVSTSTKMSHSR